MAKAKGGQKFGKWGPPSNGQHNAYPNQGKPKRNQNPQRKGFLSDRRSPARGFRQTEKFQQVIVFESGITMFVISCGGFDLST